MITHGSAGSANLRDKRYTPLSPEDIRADDWQMIIENRGFSGILTTMGEIF